MKPKPQEKSKKATDHPTQHHWHEMNRKQRREMIRKMQSEDLSLEVIHPDAAGIDIGNESHYAAVPPSRDSQPVRRFGCTTAELKAMAAWLKQCGIRTVAMQSTGVYWVAVYDILEQAGLEVYLVNARDTKNLPGRKSDVQESQWLMKLHTYGLLRNSFRPAQRSGAECGPAYSADAEGADADEPPVGQCVERCERNDRTSHHQGHSGRRRGERDPHKLAAFRDCRVKASEEQIARSLEGNWQEDLLFVLKQEQDGYEFCQKQMAECDRQLAQYLQQRKDRSQGATLPEEKRKGRLKKKRANKPQFDLRAELFRISGTDLTRIDSIDVMTAMTVISEAGWDMSKWETEHHFVSWLRLCPENRISGAKIIGKGRLPTNNPISVALKIAASTLRLSKTYLGAQFRRFRTRLGAPIAIKAMAAKLARLVYRMLRYGMKYVDQGAVFYEAQHRLSQIKQLKWKAHKLGFRIVQTPAA